jgi:hypothetical protein
MKHFDAIIIEPGGWLTLRVALRDATTTIAAPSFAIFEGWEARTLTLTQHLRVYFSR